MSLTTEIKLVIGLILLILLNPINGQDRQPITTIRESIFPLVSTMRQVEKRLGSPISRNNYIHVYDITDARITIWYGGVNPGENGCKLDVSNDTVIDILVSPKKRPLLSNLEFDLRRFKKEQTLDDDVWNYVDEELGILLNTYESSSAEKYVIFAKFSPKAKDEKKKCVRIKN